jgi:hypothetical protein
MTDSRHTKPKANDKSESLDRGSLHRVRPVLIVLTAFTMVACCSLLLFPGAKASSEPSPRGYAAAANSIALAVAPQATPTPTVIQFRQASYQVGEGTVQTNMQYNPAFVLIQYFGYLRRNANDAPDNNFSGYDFWLNKLNQFSQPGEDVSNDQVALARVKRAEMVKAFLASGEYRQRFRGSVPPTGAPDSMGSSGVGKTGRNPDRRYSR